MSQNFYTRLALVILIVLWSLYEVYPPTKRDLIEHFQSRAVKRDVELSNIVYQARELRKTHPDREYGNLVEAIGTNDITKYFPFFEPRGESQPNLFVLNRLQREALGKIKLGLDLQGGTSFLVQMATNNLTSTEIFTNSAGKVEVRTNQNVTLEGALAQAVEVLRKRVDKFGVAEPLIQPVGADRILIQLPGLADEVRERAKQTIQKVAYLEFRMVHDESDQILQQDQPIPPGYESLSEVSNVKGVKQVRKYVVRKKPEMVGGVTSAFVTRDNMGQPQISFRLDSVGAQKFGEITRNNVGKFLAIVLDGELQTAPRINSAIEGGSGVIEGSYTAQQAYALANVLENPLQAPVKIESSEDVAATLGADSIRSGITASIVGILAVAGFMLVYYLLAGMVANVALITNIIILLGVMCSIGTTFTLPGIAGVVLTVGMAVDANVLIYERIREERAKGKSLRGAISAGYDRAFGTIFDSHVTTLISSIILIIMGSGSVKGFGVALTIGVAASLFTALVVTRLIFDWMLAKGHIQDIKMLHIIRDTKIDFMRLRWPLFIATWVFIAIGIGYGLFVRGHEVLGVQFTGGDAVELRFDQSKNIPIEDVRKSVNKLGFGEALIGYQSEVGTGTKSLRITVREIIDKNTGKPVTNAVDRVVAQLQGDFEGAKFEKKKENHVGATVGSELRNTAIIASLLAMFGILIYVAFRYEFSFAVGAVVAIVHDVLMTLGCYFLAGRELNDTTVAAILTIIGFSINDTIVIFDRIREDLKLGVRGSFRELINQALNQTLSRTIITSGTVFLATLSLFVFGGGPINDFAFTFLVGIITGTYSSIYIATFLVLLINKGQRPKIGSATQLQVESKPATARA